MAKLLVRLEDGRQREYELAPVSTVGRHPNQSIQILDRLVSKAHVVLKREGDGWLLHDLGSLNGTFVNERQVTGVVPLKHEDRITVGNTQMVFQDTVSEATGSHRVAIGDNLESSIGASLEQRSVDEFQPAHMIDDVDVLRNDYEKLRIGMKLGQEIALEVRLEKLLPKLLDHLFGLFKADRGVILLREGMAGRLTPRAVRMRGRERSSEPIAISQTILNKVIDEKSGVLTNDAQKDARFSHARSVIIQGIRSTMCVPLLARDRRVLGVIHVDSLLVANAFTERDLNMLTGVASQAAIAIENSQLVARIQEEAVTRQKFEKMLSPNLVEKVVSGELQIEKGGEPKNAAVMFCDIRGFTALTEKSPPQQIVKMLNEYFELLVDVIFEFDGTLDKYIGDSVMAVWGAPVEDPEASRKAVLAAVAIQKALKKFNSLREYDGLPAIDTGIGVDAGHVVAGYMGSSKTMAYTVVGPHVNQASRLCSKAGPGQVLISDDVRRRVPDVAAIEQPPLDLKGISGLVTNYSVRID